MIIVKNHSGLLSANPLPWQERAIAFGAMPQLIACFIEPSNNCQPQNMLTGNGLLMKGNLGTEEVSDTEQPQKVAIDVGVVSFMGGHFDVKVMLTKHYTLFFSSILSKSH